MDTVMKKTSNKPKLVVLAALAVVALGAIVFGVRRCARQDSSVSMLSIPDSPVTQRKLGDLYRTDLVVTEIDQSRLVGSDSFTNEVTSIASNLLTSGAIEVGPSGEEFTNTVADIAAGAIGRSTNTQAQIARIAEQVLATSDDLLAIVENTTMVVLQDPTSPLFTNTSFTNAVSNVAHRIVGEMVIPMNLEFIGVYEKMDSLLISNSVLNARMSGVETLYDINEATISNLNERIRPAADYRAYPEIATARPVIQTVGDGGLAFSVYCEDGKYHDVNSIPASTFPEFSLSDMYGKSFSSGVLSGVFGGSITWGSGITPDEGNINEPLSSVCAVTGFPQCYGREATVKDLCYSILANSTNVWRNTTFSRSNAVSGVEVRGLARVGKDIMDYAEGAHRAVVDLRRELDASPAGGMYLARPTVAYDSVTLVPDTVVSASVPPGIPAINVAIPADRGGSTAPRKTTYKSYITATSVSQINVTAEDGTVVGNTAFGVYPGGFMVTVERISAGESGNTYLSTIVPADFEAGKYKADFSSSNADLMAAIGSQISSSNTNLTSLIDHRVTSNTGFVDSVEILFTSDNMAFRDAVDSRISSSSPVFRSAVDSRFSGNQSFTSAVEANFTMGNDSFRGAALGVFTNIAFTAALSRHISPTNQAFTNAVNSLIGVNNPAFSNEVSKLIIPPTPPLAGVQFDFHHGSNATQVLYIHLTNIIHRLGGTTCNTPSF